jgi:hypothetical protein
VSRISGQHRVYLWSEDTGKKELLRFDVLANQTNFRKGRNMKRPYLLIALAFLTGAITLTPIVNRTEHVLASPATPAATEPLAGGTDALLLSCMDYRLTDEIADYMQNHLHMKRKYD